MYALLGSRASRASAVPSSSSAAAAVSLFSRTGSASWGSQSAFAPLSAASWKVARRSRTWHAYSPIVKPELAPKKPNEFVGKRPLPILHGVTVEVDKETRWDEGWQMVYVRGPMATLELPIASYLDIELDESSHELRLQPPPATDLARTKAYDFRRRGLYRSLIWNALRGVTSGHKKRLEIRGIGYRWFWDEGKQGRVICIRFGGHATLKYEIPPEVIAEFDKSNRLSVFGACKSQVGTVAAAIRGLRKPEPYKGKGIRYLGEKIEHRVRKGRKRKGGATAGARR